jgi:MYXO-CTERM domain-containing protein
MRLRLGMRALAVPSTALLVSLALTGTARANGRMAAGHQVVVSPVDPNFFVMETTFGLLVSHDAWTTLGWVCESPIGYGDGGVQDPSVGLTQKAILAGLRQGLARSSDQGCSWSFALRDPVVDVVVRRDDPHSALALTTKYVGSGDAGENLFTTRVLMTHDDGATWTQVGSPLDPAVQVETIDVAPSDPNRIYVGGSGQRIAADGGAVRFGVVLASTDGGASYTQSAIALDPANFEDLDSAYVSAVDPTTASRVYVRIGGAGAADRLLVSDDGATTFRTVFQGAGSLLGFALSTDGSTVFVGGPADGVASAPAWPADSGAALAFKRMSKLGVSCLAWTGGKLYACMGEPQNSYRQELGVSTDDGATFAPEFLFACIPGPLVCPGSPIEHECSAGLGLLRASVGICDSDAAAAPCDGGCDSDGASGPSTDASLDGGGPVADAGGGPALHPKSGCGCRASEAAGASGFSAVALLALLVARRRRS